MRAAALLVLVASTRVATADALPWAVDVGLRGTGSIAVAEEPDADEQCDARFVLSGGIDAGIALFHFDAPPELSASSDALLYWGPSRALAPHSARRGPHRTGSRSGSPSAGALPPCLRAT
jgi:hypothetical protein